MIRVGELRKKRNLTQKQLADIMGIDQTAISNWERGKVLPDNANLLKLANFFNVSLDYLLGRSQTDNVHLALSTSDIDLITYAAHNGLTIDDLMEFIDFVNKIKHKTHSGAPKFLEETLAKE